MANVKIPSSNRTGSTSLPRRSSSVSASSKLSLHHDRGFSSASSPSRIITTASYNGGGFELFPTKAVQYTSLKDILPPSSAVNSPRAMPPGPEILIRNHLVKQAAWAYLQPMSTSPGSSGQGFLRKLRLRFSGSSLLDLVDRRILLPLTRAVNWLLSTIGIRSVRC